MSTPKSIYDLEGEWSQLLEIAELGYDPDTGEAFDPEDIDHAFAALTDDIEEKMAGCAFVTMRLRSNADAIDGEIKRLLAKRKSMENGRQRLLERMRELMTRAELDKVKALGVSISLAKHPRKRVDVVDVFQLDAQYLRPERDPEPDKVAILAALKAGREVEGAQLVDGNRTLTVR